MSWEWGQEAMGSEGHAWKRDQLRGVLRKGSYLPGGVRGRGHHRPVAGQLPLSDAVFMGTAGRTSGLEKEPTTHPEVREGHSGVGLGLKAEGSLSPVGRWGAVCGAGSQPCLHQEAGP